MSGAREVVLGRIRTALVGVDAVTGTVPRPYRRAGTLAQHEVLARLVERLEDYGASVVQTDEPAVAAGSVLASHGARRVVVARDLPVSLRPEGIQLVEDAGLPALALDELDAALTTCAAACAETGTLALDGGPGQGRRATTLVPDLHVCVVQAAQVVETVPELVERLMPSACAGRPIVLVSGPSATSDIELSRIEGVHGPRRLVVICSFGPPAWKP